jgi:hypothetical protein
MKPAFALSTTAAAVSFAFVSSIASAAPFAQPQSVVATQESYQSVSYTVAAHSKLTEILVPVTNRPIHMMAACAEQNDPGLGSATIMRLSNGFSNSLEWVGADLGGNRSGNANIGTGIEEPAGTHIIYADYFSYVDVEVQNDAHLQIQNNYDSPVKVIITFTY